MGKVLGLAMTGGGARGAYQAGVLKRIGELSRVQKQGNPFQIIGGASAGAINGSALAAGSDDFASVTKVVSALWSNLQPDDVFRCDFVSQAHNSLVWLMDLSLGGALGGGNARSLLDATPLRHYLSKHLDCGRIQDNIRRGHLYALAISATNYSSGKSYLFIQGAKGHPMWNRSRRVTLATKITVEHICASAAIPLVFQPVRLETDRLANPVLTGLYDDLIALRVEAARAITRRGIKRGEVAATVRSATIIELLVGAMQTHWILVPEAQLPTLYRHFTAYAENVVDIIVCGLQAVAPPAPAADGPPAQARAVLAGRLRPDLTT